MPTLPELQAAFGHALQSGGAPEPMLGDVIQDGPISVVERLAIHRGTFIAGAVGALRLTFPAVERLVGADFFEGAATAFIEAAPPSSAWLDDYGAGFAAFLEGLAPARPLPYLADVARLEWAASRAAHAPDAPVLDPGSLATLSVEAQALLRLAAHPAVQLIALSYPAEAIWRAVLAEDEAGLGATRIVADPHWLLLQRASDGLALRRLDEAEGAFTAGLFTGRPLCELLTPDMPPGLLALLAEHLAQGRFAAPIAPRA